jgi:hypothetical protein
MKAAGHAPALREAFVPPRAPSPGPAGQGAPAAMSSRHFGLTNRHIVIFVSGLFLVSNALIAPGLALVPALLVILGCVGALYCVISATATAKAGVLASRVDPTSFAGCWLAALALCVVGGEGHFFFANYDWLTRDAVLADLVRQGFPAVYDYQASEFVLRAPLGMYMIPAAVGHTLGLHAAHLALLAQNVTILALTLILFAAMAPGRKAVFLAVFVAFSGVEVIGRFLNAGLTASASGTFSWPLHAHQHLAWWNPFFQYTNHITQIFWVPNHALPGWWLAALSVLHVRREIGSPALIVAFAFLLVLRRDVGAMLTPRLLLPCLAALCFVPIVAYLNADAGSVPHLWQFLMPGFWSVYVIFILIQIPHAGVVAQSWERLEPGLRTLSILAVGLLLLIPIYRLGSNNDLAMRASIMPLALLAFVFASIAAQLQWRDGVKRIAPVAAIIGLGCITPVLEIQRPLMLSPFATSDCNLMTAWNELEPDRWLASYFARVKGMPAWLLRHDGAGTPAKIEDRQCWPDHPYVQMKVPKALWREPEQW